MSRIHKLIYQKIRMPAHRKRGALTRIIDTPQPSVGVIIGTYAALPYVHLQLEARRRFWPDTPALVHDDCSPIQHELRQLCRSYDVEFIATPRRMGHYPGDIQTFVAGLDWARQNDLELVVKISRRFLIYQQWVSALQELAYQTQYATYGNGCLYRNFPLRSECMALHTRCWHQSGAAETLRQRAQNYDSSSAGRALESWYHDLAKQVHRALPLTTAALHDQFFVRGSRWDGSDWGGYGVWPLVAGGYAMPGVLWRHTHPPQAYAAQAHQWGLCDYGEADFADVNLGQGKGATFVEKRRWWRRPNP